MLILLLLLACVGQEPTPPPAAAPDPVAQADPALRATRAIPTSGAEWAGSWSVRVLAAEPFAEGAEALAARLGAPLRVWSGERPSTSGGQLAVLWLQPGEALGPLAEGLAPRAADDRGSVVVVLGPGQPSWSRAAAQLLPWSMVELVDSAASAALWVEPGSLDERPALAGCVAAWTLAEHFQLDWRPGACEAAGLPGLEQLLGPVAVEHLEHGDPRVRAAAALVGGADALVADEQVAVRLAVAASSRDGAVLRRLAADVDPLVRARACALLDDVGLLAARSQDPSSVVRVLATHRLGELAAQGVQDERLVLAVRAAAQGSPDAYQRWKAAWALGFLGGDSRLLQILLDDPDVDVSREAARSLGRLRAVDSVEALLRAAVSSNSFLRRSALRALGEIGDPRALPVLRAGLDDPTVLVAAEAAQALTRLGEPARVPSYHPPTPPADSEALAAMASSSDATLRKDACKFMGGQAEALPLLASLAADADAEVRKAAAEALGYSPGQAERLLPLLGDLDLDGLITTLDALRRSGGASAEQLAPLAAHGDAEVRLRALEALAELGAGPALERALTDGDERMRAAAASVYPRRIDPDEPSVLVRRAAARAAPRRWGEDPDLLVRAAASQLADPHLPWWARGVIAREDDLLHLRFSFNDPEERPDAYRALRPPVVREYGHPDRG